LIDVIEACKSKQMLAGWSLSGAWLELSKTVLGVGRVVFFKLRSVNTLWWLGMVGVSGHERIHNSLNISRQFIQQKKIATIT
jgi:hypothetical protein